PEATGRVEIIVVEAKVYGINGNEIKRKLVHQTEGNRSATVGNLCLKLVSVSTGFKLKKRIQTSFFSWIAALKHTKITLSRLLMTKYGD
nr:hypothetical protein [Tanacetum cinerariifolium]